MEVRGATVCEMALRQFDWFPATFQPQRLDDLSPGAEEWIGWAGLWEAAFLIEEGPYTGQFACVVQRKYRGAQMGPPPEAFVWVPESDLVPVQFSDAELAALVQRAGEILEKKLADKRRSAQ